MRYPALFLLLGLARPAFAQVQCNCLEYPFRPDPPCSQQCFKVLVDSDADGIAGVRDLDPGVAVHLRILRTRKDKSEIDFSSLKSKRDLESFSLKSLEKGSVRLEGLK